MKLEFKKMILGSLVLNVLFLIFGIVIYINPYILDHTVAIILGLYFIAFGVFGIVEYFMRDLKIIFSSKIFLGILSIFFGIFVIANPFKINKILTFTLGLYLIVLSFSKMFEAFKLRKYGYDGWLFLFVTGVLLFVFGVFIAINPMAKTLFVQAGAIFIILSMILEICNYLMIYRRSKQIVKILKKN